MWNIVIEYDFGNNKRLVLCSSNRYSSYRVGIADDKKILAEFIYTATYDRAFEVYKKELIRHKEIYELSEKR